MADAGVGEAAAAESAKGAGEAAAAEGAADAGLTAGTYGAGLTGDTALGLTGSSALTSGLGASDLAALGAGGDAGLSATYATPALWSSSGGADIPGLTASYGTLPDSASAGLGGGSYLTAPDAAAAGPSALSSAIAPAGPSALSSAIEPAGAGLGGAGVDPTTGAPTSGATPPASAAQTGSPSLSAGTYGDLSNAGGPNLTGGTGLTAPPAPAPGFVDKALNAVSNNPLQAANLGLGAASLGKQLLAPNAQSQYKAVAGPTSAAANQLLQQFQSGTLNGADAYAISQWTTQQKAAVDQYYAKAGLSNSSMHQQAVQQIDAQAESMRQQAVQNLLTNGLKAAGVANPTLTAGIQAGLTQDQQSMTAMQNFINQLAKMNTPVASSPAQSQTGSPTGP